MLDELVVKVEEFSGVVILNLNGSSLIKYVDVVDFVSCKFDIIIE